MKASVLIARLKAAKRLHGDFHCTVEVDGEYLFIDDVEQKEERVWNDGKIHIVFDLIYYRVKKP